MLMISSVANVICGPNDTFNIEINAERYNLNVETYPLRTSRSPGRKMRRIVVSEPSTSTTAIPKAAVIHHFPRNLDATRSLAVTRTLTLAHFSNA